MTEGTKGILAMIGAATIWGLSPLFYAMLVEVPPLDVLAFRSIWSLVFFVVVLLIQRRTAEVVTLISSGRNLVLVVIATLMISANWFGFIFAIQAGRTIEASLGYYIFPLLAVLLGRIVLGERLAWLQWCAVALAAAAVVTLTYGLGVAPWIALSLAGTFGAYGLVKNRLDAGPVVSVTAEVLVLLPIAVLWLAVFSTGGHHAGTYALLALSGPLTAMPLMLFSYASRRIRLSTVGLVQYLNPTLQFICAVVVLGDVFTPWHGIAFPLIWVGLAIYSASAIVQDRASRRAVSSVATSGTAVT